VTAAAAQDGDHGRPIDGQKRNCRGEHRDQHREPHQEAADEQVPAGADKASLQVAIPGIAHLEALERRAGERIGEAERQHCPAPPPDRADRIMDGVAGLMKPQSPEHRAGQPVAARQIDTVLAKKNEQQHGRGR
jgi:hypothetical protein